MSFSSAGRWAAGLAAAILATFPCAPQNTPAPAPQTTSPQQPVAPQQPANPQPTGKVIFSRSTDENGQTTTQVGPGAQPSAQMVTEPVLEDADRLAVTVTALDLDVRLHTITHQLDVRALVTVRNDGKSPRSRIPLQISSSLNWEQIRVEGKSVSFPVATLNSDSDHTGQLHEAAVPLATPLAPGASIQLDTVYSGAVANSAQRLTTLGTPESVALHSDWDTIAPDFTGLRGFGNVVWYPVSSIPVILGDGARLFDEIGRQKLSLSSAHFSLRLTIEFPHGAPPGIAVINGHPAQLTADDAKGLDADLSGIATAGMRSDAIGFQAPSIFVAIRKQHKGENLTAWTTPDNEVNVQAWLDAASAVTPFLENWLGRRPAAQLTLIDLPDPEDAPFETGNLLAVPLQDVAADHLDGALAHALTHAYAPPDAPAWLNEGLATFMESLWVEKRQGRDRALQMLESGRSALALAEPSSPGESAGTPLAQAIAPAYYRTKATYVLWMLRDLTSDDVLSSALRACNERAFEKPQSPTSSSSSALPSASTGEPSCALQSLLQLPGVNHDLTWLFTDWVEADKGLPDLSIAGVFPNPSAGGTVLVAVSVANAGYAAAEVPVIVRTANGEATDWLLVPARGQAVQRILVTGVPTQVQVNDGTVPETQASVHVTDLDKNAKPIPGTSSNGQQNTPQPE
jgi:hypothetical protein